MCARESAFLPIDPTWLLTILTVAYRIHQYPLHRLLPISHSASLHSFESITKSWFNASKRFQHYTINTEVSLRQVHRRHDWKRWEGVIANHVGETGGCRNSSACISLSARNRIYEEMGKPQEKS